MCSKYWKLCVFIQIKKWTMYVLLQKAFDNLNIGVVYYNNYCNGSASKKIRQLTLTNDIFILWFLFCSK